MIVQNWKEKEKVFIHHESRHIKHKIQIFWYIIHWCFAFLQYLWNSLILMFKITEAVNELMTQLDLHNECLHQLFASLIMQQRLAKIIHHICHVSPQTRHLAEKSSTQKGKTCVQIQSVHTNTHTKIYKFYTKV